VKAAHNWVFSWHDLSAYVAMYYVPPHTGIIRIEAIPARLRAGLSQFILLTGLNSTKLPQAQIACCHQHIDLNAAKVNPMGGA
jgi:hypothetical protein